MIRDIKPDDAKRIAEIYNYYIKETIITFEYDTISEFDIKRRIEKIQQKGFPFFVYEKDNEIVGYAYLSNWRERIAYDITLETSVYLDQKAIGSGIGSILYKELIDRAQKIDIHSLIGVISLPNIGSQKLHKKFNFELIGCFKEAGVKFGKLIDVEFWQLIL
ncbi:N-acetyltransferase [Dysgonomonas sp. Marseille-P4677]|uniref:GNAT family N-acetyltransferase n=1 Tax=Dysgonomonas sp. Marseille-P4677 TaxID=2364790 RepID=UPI001912568F|nr:GNAT family N-acetyltransferase [Dysgonomonas sp. Marseille-P4677]MBK5721159.1 N-acetyltransferase [Dysgonomonas sp. Marseille-P4677]